MYLRIPATELRLIPSEEWGSDTISKDRREPPIVNLTLMHRA